LDGFENKELRNLIKIIFACSLIEKPTNHRLLFAKFDNRTISLIATVEIVGSADCFFLVKICKEINIG
jgi:hypothetical protein